MVIHGVNGILSHGSGSTDLLLYRLQELGHATNDVAIPLRGIVQSYFDSINKKDGALLNSLVEPGDVAVSHSRGGLVVLEAMKLGARFSKVFLLAPAMRRDVVFPYFGATEIHILCNKHDTALKLGRWLPFRHPFGALGLYGATVKDPRIRGFQAGVFSDLPFHVEHSEAWFGALTLEDTAQYIDASVRGSA